MLKDVVPEPQSGAIGGVAVHTHSYNDLNCLITANDWLSYSYLADGQKREKRHDQQVTHYRGTATYNNDGTPDYVLHPEGMAKHLGNRQWDWHYHLHDYLGNTRAVIDEAGEVLQQTDYYPFGTAFALDNTDKNKYLYGGKELQDEVLSGTQVGLYDFHARFYDSNIGGWSTMDPLAEKYYNVSPYVYCNNNPVLYVDPNGMDWYLFDNETQRYTGSQEMEGVHRMVVSSTDSDGNTTYRFYDFNDPSADARSIKNGEINRMEYLADDAVEMLIDNSGVKTEKARSSKWSYAANNAKGFMDYGHSSTLGKQTFYIREGIAYNVGDIGNYLCGRGMAELGFGLGDAKLGAHVNNMLNGRRQESTKYNFGEGTYNGVGFWDSEGDQRAITNGYTNSPAGKRRIEENRIRSLQTRKKYERGGIKFSMSIL